MSYLRASQLLLPNLLCLFMGALLNSDSLAQDAVGKYDPLKIDSTAKIETLLLDVEYQPQAKLFARGGGNANGSSEARKVPIKVYLPASTSPQKKVPVVLFSHGLGGSREGFKHGGEHWAARGYVAVFLQHPGSDESVWRQSALGQRMGALRDAASGQNLILRVQDVKAVIDYLEAIERGDEKITGEAKQLANHIDTKRIGMSGHSFGAMTTQMVSGQTPFLPNQKPTDDRIRAAIVLSPSAPKAGSVDKSFGSVSIPWLLMTGTKDNSPIGDQTAENRLQVFKSLPAGDKYEVIFEGGTHAFLGERGSLLSQEKEQTTTHARATEALTTAFWDAYLNHDQAAKDWLNGEGVKSVLAAKDEWLKK